MADHRTFGDVVETARRGAKEKIVSALRGRSHAEPGSPSDGVRQGAEPAQNLTALEPLLQTRDDTSIRRVAVARGREAELESILAVRTTVMPVSLTADDVNAFFAQGFLIVSQMSSPEELQVIRAIYDRLFEDQVGRAYGLYIDIPQQAELEGEFVYPKINQIYRVAPELCATGFMANAWAVAGQLFGAEVEFLGGHGFLKPGLSPSHTPWHQDQAYHRPDLAFQNVNVWLALQDTPLESGVMEFVPGSHRGAHVFEHRRPGGNPNSHGLELADSSVLNDVVPCPLSAGDATLHHSYMLHHTPPNQTTAARRALIAIFGLPPEQRAEPLRLAWQDPSSVRAEPGSGPRIQDGP